MDKFKELYQYLVDNEMTDLSEEEFKVEYAQGTDKKFYTIYLPTR